MTSRTADEPLQASVQLLTSFAVQPGARQPALPCWSALFTQVSPAVEQLKGNCAPALLTEVHHSTLLPLHVYVSAPVYVHVPLSK